MQVSRRLAGKKVSCASHRSNSVGLKLARTAAR